MMSVMKGKGREKRGGAITASITNEWSRVVASLFEKLFERELFFLSAPSRSIGIRSIAQ